MEILTLLEIKYDLIRSALKWHNVIFNLHWAVCRCVRYAAVD
ncbi:hypothetical protein M8C21_023097 [Ambrosia artemisiifolia]|uniref:Uncharacterized protein n=1 Tax=Ambrosia artemisiifolia TaxID=4212 RepID=A0AAD5BVK8_AMBAR|nr:hypothetical protein M8C21_023097 [Ambrosia artemisiifolia]